MNMWRRRHEAQHGHELSPRYNAADAHSTTPRVCVCVSVCLRSLSYVKARRSGIFYMQVAIQCRAVYLCTLYNVGHAGQQWPFVSRNSRRCAANIAIVAARMKILFISKDLH